MSPETQTYPVQTELTPDDQQWLANFGVDPSWTKDPSAVSELNELIQTGSQWLTDDNPLPQETRQQVIDARQAFMAGFAQISVETLDRFKDTNPTLIPLDTFIETRRELHRLGLDGVKVVNTLPAALGLNPESVRDKMANLEELGLDGVKVVNALPAVLSLNPESVRDKMANLEELGLDGVKVVNTHPAALNYNPESVRDKMNNLESLGLDDVKVVNALPTALSYNPESVRDKMANLEELGLDGVKVVNTLPSALGFNPESVRDKMANLESLGLDGVKVVNTLPAALGLNPESVRDKMAFLERTAKLLQWDYTAKELVETFPAILGYNKKKLTVLRRIASGHIDESGRQTQPSELRGSLIVPLEKYILAVDQQSTPGTLKQLERQARKHKLDSAERKEKALSAAQTNQSLGRIGTLYLEYRGKEKV